MVTIFDVQLDSNKAENEKNVIFKPEKQTTLTNIFSLILIFIPFVRNQLTNSGYSRYKGIFLAREKSIIKKRTIITHKTIRSK
ncbi:hypothetical protein BKI52_14530 [marine bacterium AO1-C]|nr:hypothetical protein BKI52_14530 [marine bacterium AO1-C]